MWFMEHNATKRIEKVYIPRAAWIDFKGAVLTCKISKQPETQKTPTASLITRKKKGQLNL